MFKYVMYICWFVLSSAAYGQIMKSALQPGDEVLVIDTLLHDTYRYYNIKKDWNKPYREQLASQHGSPYTWEVWKDSAGHILREGLWKDEYTPVGVHTFFGKNELPVKTYDYTHGKITYLNGYADKYSQVIDSLIRITRNYIEQWMGTAAFAGTLQFKKEFRWEFRYYEYDYYPVYPDSVPAKMEFTYLMYPDYFEFPLEIKFITKGFDLQPFIVVNSHINEREIPFDEVIFLPLKWDYTKAVDMFAKHGFVAQPELFYNEVLHSFMWVNRTEGEGPQGRMKEMVLNAYTGKYTIKQFEVANEGPLCAGFISNIDTTCYFTDSVHNGLKVYYDGRIHMAVPDKDFMYRWNNATTMIAGEKDTVFSWMAYDEDRVAFPEEDDAVLFYPPTRQILYGKLVTHLYSGEISLLSSWMEPVQWCKKTSRFSVIQINGQNHIVIDAVEYGAYYNFNSLWYKVVLWNVDMNNLQNLQYRVKNIWFY